MANATDNGTVLHAIDFHSSLLFTVGMCWLSCGWGWATNGCPCEMWVNLIVAGTGISVLINFSGNMSASVYWEIIFE